jgi:subtilisin-like proprotein convertase family protein
LEPDPGRPVWGDFDLVNDGIRGRNVRVGVIDDGLELNHLDLQGNLADVFEHHAYDLEPQTPTPQNPNPPPRVKATNGQAVNHQQIYNNAHGTNMAGIIGAVTNNNLGVSGVAPNCKLIGVRALSDFEDEFGAFLPVPTDNDQPLQGDLIAPMADVLFAAAYLFLYNDNAGFSFNGHIVYPGTPDENQLPTFGDSNSGITLPIKNNSWGAPDFATFAGPGPEVAGVTVSGVTLQTGVRRKSVEEGRNGLGTIFVHPSGNGRVGRIENANSDGWSNAREVICVGALALPQARHFDSPTADHCSTYSEPGSCVMISAPGGGPYIVGKGNRAYDGLYYTAIATQASLALTTTDYSGFIPADPDGDPPRFQDFFGINHSGENGDYSDGAFTKRSIGTSSAAAVVSGVIALMLEANPRLSWLDVQNILIRTAKNHIDPLAYALDPTDPTPILNLFNGVDTADPQDVVTIDRDWKKNGGHLWFNHKYGAGMVNARGAVDMALSGALLPPQTQHLKIEAEDGNPKDLPDATANGTGTPYDIRFNASGPPDFVITHVTVHFDKITTNSVGDLFIKLIAPSGMESILMEPHFDFSNDLVNWTFSSVFHWGESVSTPTQSGWTLRIQDNLVGNLTSLNKPEQGQPAPKIRLTLHGYIRPAVPVITTPASADPLVPTQLIVVKNRSMSYILSGNNDPTAWNTRYRTPDMPSGQWIQGLPPGLSFEALAPNPSNTILHTRKIIGSPTTVGEYLIEVIAANVGGSSLPHYLNLTVGDALDCYTDWARTYFGPAAATDPRAQGTADPEGGKDSQNNFVGDGFSNSVEFALGMSPLLAFDPANAFTLDTDSLGGWRLAYKRFTDRGNFDLSVMITYEVQVSDDLQNWTTVAGSGPNPGPTVSLNADYEVAEGEPAALDEPCGAYIPVTVTPLLAQPAHFFRIRITPYRLPLNP